MRCQSVYPVYPDTEPYYIAGERYWFLYSARGCGRQVFIFYGGAIFVCRQYYRRQLPVAVRFPSVVSSTFIPPPVFVGQIPVDGARQPFFYGYAWPPAQLIADAAGVDGIARRMTG